MSEEIDTRALAMATHTLLLKLIVVMKGSGTLDPNLLLKAVEHGREMLEEGGDPLHMRASLFLEHLSEEILAG